MDIAEFLTARLDEDEQAAYAAATVTAQTPAPMWSRQCDHVYAAEPVTPPPAKPGVRAWTSPQHWIAEVDERAGEHIARHDPARVLADVAAKRAIVAGHSTRVYDLASTPGLQFWCSTCHVPGDYAGRRYCLTLRALAAPYVDHPDYDQSWRLVEHATR